MWWLWQLHSELTQSASRALEEETGQRAFWPPTNGSVQIQSHQTISQCPLHKKGVSMDVYISRKCKCLFIVGGSKTTFSKKSHTWNSHLEFDRNLLSNVCVTRCHFCPRLNSRHICCWIMSLHLDWVTANCSWRVSLTSKINQSCVTKTVVKMYYKRLKRFRSRIHSSLRNSVGYILSVFFFSSDLSVLVLLNALS